MAPHTYIDALNKALNAELLQWGGTETTGTSWRRGRTWAALVFGAAAVVGTGEPSRSSMPTATRSSTEVTGVGRLIPATYRPASERFDSAAQALTTAQARLESGHHTASAVASLAIEIGRLQRDVALRSPDGMEECIGEAYACLEAVRRAVTDVVVDAEGEGVVRAALDRTAQLVLAA